jgi:class 3 adenylate cyclase
VNLASRLESATKEAHAELLSSDAAVQAARASGAALPALAEIGSIHVRGHEAPVVVHTLAAVPTSS